VQKGEFVMISIRNQFMYVVLVFLSSFSLFSMDLPVDMQLATDEDYADYFDALERERTERKRARPEEQDYLRAVRARLVQEGATSPAANITEPRTWQAESSTTSTALPEEQAVARTGSLPLPLQNSLLRQNILRFMDTQTLGRLAAAGQAQREWVTRELTPVVLTQANLTEEYLTTHNTSFVRARSLTLAPLPSAENDDEVEGYTDEQINLVVQYFPNVTHLTLAGTLLSPPQIQIIGQAFPRLVYLDLSQNNLAGLNDVTGLRNAAFAQTLRELNVEDNTLSLDALRLIGSTFHNLTRFNIADNLLLESEAITIISASFPWLTELDLSNSDLSAASLGNLQHARFASTLRRLNLSRNRLNTAVLRALGNTFIQLTYLDISRTRPVNLISLLSALTTTPLAHSLEYLNVSDVLISPKAVEIIARGFTRLTELVLGERAEDLGLEVIRPLANARFAQTLRALTLLSIRSSDIGAIINLLAETFPHLTTLNISRWRGLSSEATEAANTLYLLERTAEAAESINLLGKGNRGKTSEK